MIFLKLVLLMGPFFANLFTITFFSLFVSFLRFGIFFVRTCLFICFNLQILFIPIFIFRSKCEVAIAAICTTPSSTSRLSLLLPIFNGSHIPPRIFLNKFQISFVRVSFNRSANSFTSQRPLLQLLPLLIVRLIRIFQS